MEELQRPPIGAVVLAKTTYHIIWRAVVPALVLMPVPFVVALAGAFGDYKIGGVLHWPLVLVQLLANAVFVAALLRHVLLNGPASLGALQLGRTEWNISAVGVLAMLVWGGLRTIAMGMMGVLMLVFMPLLGMFGSGFQWLFFLGWYLVIFLYLNLRFMAVLPLIVKQGENFADALTKSWSMTRGRVGSLFWALVLLIVPIEAIFVLGMNTVNDHILWQPDLMRVFVTVFGEYIVMTALTILSAVVFQGLDQHVKPVRTP